MIRVGIDPSTKRIAIVAEVDEPRSMFVRAYELVKKTEKQTPQSLAVALTSMRDFVQWVEMVAPDGERLAWVESPLVGRGGVTTTMKQAYVGGIIRAVLAEAGFVVTDVNVSTWKKSVTGNGRSQKPAVKTSVQQSWPKVANLVGADGDLIDAAAILLHGRAAKTQEHVPAPAAAGGHASVGQPTVLGGRPKPVVRRARLRP